MPAWQAEWALFLDVDGTLIEIAATPASVVISPRVVPALSGVATRLGGALALISGRPIDELDRLLAPLVLPTAGLHGLERRAAAGRTSSAQRPAAVAQAARALGEFAAREPGLLLEDKGASLALHYRAAAQWEDEARALVERLLAGLGDEFELQEGKMVLEIKPRGADKGKAIEQFMAEPPFAGRVPVFIGDDLTDEDGFAMVNGLGGHSIAVDRAHAATCARWHLADVEAVIDWLECGATGAETHA